MGIDCIFGLPETDEGYRGILVITEYLTKYPCAVPFTSKSSEEIAGHLLIYISIFGCPKESSVRSRIGVFNSIIKELTRTAGIEHRVASPYHP